jgi:peptidoglycan/xylan/chitin deacetylase (PgdA/CDA1 family)
MRQKADEEQRMIAEGHQIASHSWSHQNLTSLDPTYFNRQVIYNEMAFNNILSVTQHAVTFWETLGTT